MAAKGSSRATCCCNGCESMPSIVLRTDGVAHVPLNPGLPLPPVTLYGHPIDVLQAACCSCMPKSVCVTIEDTENNSSHAITPIRCGLNNADTSSGPFALLYSLTLPFMGHEIDLEFWLKVIDGVCFFCLESAVLAVNECQEINASKRLSREEPYDGFCYELNSDDTHTPRQYQGTKWTIEDATLGTLTIRIKSQNTTPITGVRPCVDDYGNIVPSESLLKSFCDGCGCLCDRACVVIQMTGINEILVSQLVLSEHNGYPAYIDEYDSDNGTIIKVVTHTYNGNDRACGLQVGQLGGGYTFVGESDVVTVQAGATGCPNPTASWELSDERNLAILVNFSCAVCGDGCQSAAAGCCPGYPIPKVLHCTIRKGPGGPSESCECLPITIPLVNTSGQPFWHGVFKSGPGSGSWCVAEIQDFGISLECGGGEWILRFGTSLYLASPCGGVIMGDDSYEMVCYPINLQFTYESYCCGYVFVPPGPPDPLSGPSSVIFEITE